MPRHAADHATTSPRGALRGARPGLRLARTLGVAAFLSGWMLPANASAQSQLIWENEYADGATAAPVTIDGTTVTITGVDASGVGSPGNFTVTYATRGAHTGYWESGLDANTQSDFLTLSLGFSQPVESLEFTLLDIDTNNQFHDSINVVGWNGTTPYTPATTVRLGSATSRRSVRGSYSGLANVGNFVHRRRTSTVTVRSAHRLGHVRLPGPGPRAFDEPRSRQVIGLLGPHLDAAVHPDRHGLHDAPSYGRPRSRIRA